jgi:hypothetical protein
MELFITYTHRSELQVIDHFHTQISLHSLLQSPLAVPWQRILKQEL